MQRVHFQNLINCLFSRALFHETLDAYDSLEDVLALRKMLFLFNLELPTRTIVDHSHLVIAKHVVEDMKYFDRRHNNMQTLNEILFDPRTKNGFLKKNMVEKITGSSDLNEVFDKYGKDGLIGILSKPPSNALQSSPTVTRTARILAAIVDHFVKRTKS